MEEAQKAIAAVNAIYHQSWAKNMTLPFLSIVMRKMPASWRQMRLCTAADLK